MSWTPDGRWAGGFRLKDAILGAAGEAVEKFVEGRQGWEETAGVISGCRREWAAHGLISDLDEWVEYQKKRLEASSPLPVVSSR